MNISDKVFCVTGAGGGIGGELVLALLNGGAKVAAVDISHDNLMTLSDRAGKSSTSLTTLQLNITEKDQVNKLPKMILDSYGQVDAVINCAGIVQPFVRVNDIDYKDIDRVMSVNFFGTLYMTKAFLPYLLKRPEAYIVNFSSMGGFLPVPGQSVYGASKAAVKLFTEGLYAELQDTNVHVSVVFPGATATDITKNSGVKVNTKSIDINKIKMLSPEKVADLTLQGIKKNKPQIFTGRDSKSMNLLYRLSPVYATKLIAKQMKSLLG